MALCPPTEGHYYFLDRKVVNPMSNDNLKPLNAQQERFCVEYVNDPKRNQTQAAIRAGYSPRSASVQGSRLLSNVKAQQRIKELQIEALEDAGYSVDTIRLLIMRKLTGIVMTDAADIAQVIYADDNKRQEALTQLQDMNGGQGIIDFGQPMIYIKPTHEWTLQQRAAVKGLEPTKEGIKIVMEDKQPAMRLLSDIVGLTKANDLNLNLSITESLTEARQRASESQVLEPLSGDTG
jgi:phage terminase small subunit